MLSITIKLAMQLITIAFHFWSIQSITITQKTAFDYV